MEALDYTRLALRASFLRGTIFSRPPPWTPEGGLSRLGFDEDAGEVFAPQRPPNLFDVATSAEPVSAQRRGEGVAARGPIPAPSPAAVRPPLS
jgi:hypothetical protein